MKQTIKSKLDQARPQPGYEFHQAVEDALDRLPPMSENRSGLRRPLMFMGAAAAVLAIALPLGMWRLSAGRPDPPQKPLAEAGARPVAATGAPGGSPIATVEDAWEPTVAQDTDKRAVPMPTVNDPDAAISIPAVSAPDDAVPMPRVIQIQTDEAADRAAENAFFEEHFPGNVLADPGVQLDGVTLALRGLRLSDDKQSLLIGAVIYGVGMSHRLVDDHERLAALYPEEIALNGVRQNNGGSNYPHTELIMEETGSGTCSVFTVPLGNFAPKDGMIPIRIALRNYSASGESIPSLAIMANLLTGEVRLPKDEQQRQEWLDQSYQPVERALRSVDPSPKRLDIAAPLGERRLRLTGFAYDGAQAGFGVILNDPEKRDLAIKQLYVYGESQLTTPLKPSQSMPVDGGYGYVFTLPLDPLPDPYGAKRTPGCFGYLVPLFQLGDDQQLIGIGYYETENSYSVQDVSSVDASDDIMLNTFADAYGLMTAYALRYDITDQIARWALPDGLTIQSLTHRVGSFNLESMGMPSGWGAKLRLNGELLMPLAPDDYEDALTLRFFTDVMPGRLPDGAALSLTLYPPDGGAPIEFPDIQLRIEDAVAVANGIPVETYPGTGIGQPYEQISASFRLNANPHFIGATVNVGQMRVTLAELTMLDTLEAGVLVEGNPDLLPPGALTFEQFRIDGAPVEKDYIGASPKYAGDAGRAYVCYAYNDGLDDRLPAVEDGKPHRIELDFVLNGTPFTLETSGTFTIETNGAFNDTCFVPEGQGAQAVPVGDRAVEQAFFAEQFDTGLLDDPGVAVDDMKLAVRGLRLSDDGQSVRVGLLLYGEGLSHKLVADHDRLSSLWLGEFALNGARLGDEPPGTTNVMCEHTDSGTCYVYEVPLGDAPVADGESIIRLVCDVGSLQVPLALKANLVTGEVWLPQHEAERWAWFGDSYTPAEQAINAMGLEPLPVGVEAPLGGYTIRIDSFGHSEAGCALAVVLNAPTPRLLTLKQLYAAGIKQLAEPMRPQSEFAVEGGYAYIFDLPIDFGENSADPVFGIDAYVAPMFELGGALQMVPFRCYALPGGRLQIAVTDGSVTPNGSLLDTDLARANHFDYGYHVAYGGLSIGLPSGAQLQFVDHHVGRIVLHTDSKEGFDGLKPPTLTLDGEPLLHMPNPDNPGAMEFFTDILPGRLPEDGEFALSVTLPVNGGSSTETTTFRLNPDDAVAYAFITPVECYEGTGIGGRYEQLSAFFRGADRTPHFIGASKTMSGATLTLAELQFFAGAERDDLNPDASTLRVGALLEGVGTPRLTHVSIDGQPLALADPAESAPDVRLFAGENALGYAFVREIPGEATATALADGRIHTVALGFAIGLDAFSFSLDGTFSAEGAFAPEVPEAADGLPGK